MQSLQNSTPPDVLLRLIDAQGQLKIGETKLRELIKSGDLIMVKIGSNSRIPQSSITSLIQRLSNRAA